MNKKIADKIIANRKKRDEQITEEQRTLRFLSEKATDFLRACSVSFGVRIFGKILSMTRQKAAVILAVLQGFLTQSAAKD